LIDPIFVGDIRVDIANKIGETLSHLNHMLKDMLMCHLHSAFHE